MDTCGIASLNLVVRFEVILVVDLLNIETETPDLAFLAMNTALSYTQLLPDWTDTHSSYPFS